MQAASRLCGRWERSVDLVMGGQNASAARHSRGSS